MRTDIGSRLPLVQSWPRGPSRLGEWLRAVHLPVEWPARPSGDGIVQWMDRKPARRRRFVSAA
jgi:hypothetical protein